MNKLDSEKLISENSIEKPHEEQFLQKFVFSHASL